MLVLGESRTVDHLTIVSGLADDEQGGVRRYFHIDGIKSIAELFALFGLYAKNAYAGFYLTLNFPGEASKKEWNEVSSPRTLLRHGKALFRFNSHTSTGQCGEGASPRRAC